MKTSLKFIATLVIFMNTLAVGCSDKPSGKGTVIPGSNADDRDQMHGKGSTSDSIATRTTMKRPDDFESSDTLYNEKRDMKPVK